MKYVLDAVLQVVFYLTPAVYSLSLVRESFGQTLTMAYGLNPFVGIVDLYRVALLPGACPAIVELGLVSLLVVPMVFAFLLLGGAAVYYCRSKDSINDHVAY